jgi:very-short-patch-repair endonuclease
MKYPQIKEICRSLRQIQTPAEKLFWENFRNRKFNGLKFNRQSPIIYETINTNEHFFFVADFYCFEKKLVIELDGPIHNFQKEKDYNRDKVIEGLGLKVLRIQNEELGNFEMVKLKILNMLDSPTYHD